jgi:hypothetical protein
MTALTAKQRRRRRRIRITGWTALTSLLLTIVGFLTWFHIVYPADRGATLEVYRDARIVVKQDPHLIVMAPVSSPNSTGVLYFPGARVDPYSYLYPLSEVAANGVTVVIMQPALNMALFDQRDFDALTLQTPAVTSWTLAGHSLGGVRACMLSSNPKVATLVLFASYCATDISHLDLDVVVVTGDQDGLINEEALRDSLALLPPGRLGNVVIDGANHASFGTYGPQPGDGVAMITAPEMRKEITKILLGSLPG